MVSRTITNTTAVNYNAENQLTGVSVGTSATLLYEGDSSRVKRIEGGTTTIYIGNYFEWSGP
jgi:hypothetical protein